MAALRPYQAEAVKGIESQWGCGNRRTLLCLATGTGKTIVMAEMARRDAVAGGRTLLLAHRGELLDQAADKLYSYAGIRCGVEKGAERCDDPYPVVVGSVQSMCRDARLARYAPDAFSLVMVDEAHHSASSSYRAVLEHFPNARVLGVTATPDRSDRRGLAEVFDSIAYEYGMASAVRDGYLVPIRALQMPVEIDLTGVRSQAGDWSAADLGSRLDPMLREIARAMVGAGCRGRKSVAFLPLCATSERFAKILQDEGLSAAHVDGNSPDRAQVLADFDAGRYDVLCNAMLLTEGWDCPSVDCVVPLRATKSRALYSQMVGRGTRLSPETGKRDLLLLDFLWQATSHDLCRPASLVAASPQVAKAMGARLEGGDAMDLLELEGLAERDVVAEREESLARELEEKRRRKARFVDPLQYAMSIEAEDLADWEPTFAWEAVEPTEKQLQALEKAGIDSVSVRYRGLASLILDKLHKRRDAGLATPKQIRQLEQRGFLHVGSWSLKDASSMISRIEANGWRTPPEVNPVTYDPREDELCA